MFLPDSHNDHVLTPSEDRMASPTFSIVICSRNPRGDSIARVLESVRQQSPAAPQSELVVVDSNSSPPLEARSLPVPAETRFVRVEEPGIFRARMAGVSAARGEWVVFVDDDNVLDRDYLEQAAKVIHRLPDIGLFCGRISGEFERPPPAWLEPFYRQLAIIDFTQDSWAREWDATRVPYWTAGMVIRRQIAKEHFDLIAIRPFVTFVMNRCEDVLLVMHTLKAGHLAGLFTALHLRHLIPKERLTVDYVKHISCETAYNMTRIRCSEFGVTVRDFLRPLKNVVLACRFGIGPRLRIAQAVAWSDLRAAIDALRASSSQSAAITGTSDSRPLC